MRKSILSLILMVIVSGCTTVKTIENKEAKNINIKPMDTIFWQMQNDELEKRKKQMEDKRLKAVAKNKRLATIIKPVGMNLKEKVEYETFELTAYTAFEESTGKSPSDPDFGVTASGVKVKENHTAACAKNIPFGTKLYVPYFDTTFVCEDRGGAIINGKIDIYMKSIKDALQFGRRKLEVAVIKPDES